MKMKYLFLVVAVLGGLFTTNNPARAQVWTWLSNAPTVYAIASSANGSKLVAAVDGVTAQHTLFGAIYTSPDSGGNWTMTSAPTNGWNTVASSADGTKLVAAGAAIYTSTNAGATWQSNSAPNANWYAVASSANGAVLVAVANAGNTTGPGPIYTSTNSGATWLATSVPTNSNPNIVTSWGCVASSADGIKLVAIANEFFNYFSSLTVITRIYTSTNSGASWIEITASGAAGTSAWNSIASSADGTKLVASTGIDHNAGVVLGQQNLSFHPVYVSTNAGSTWTATGLPNDWWQAVASSADGTGLVAAGNSGYASAVYTSVDAGGSWRSNSAPPISEVGFLAYSADGCKLLAGYGSLWVTWLTTPTPLLSMAPSSSNALLSWTIPSLDFTLQQNSDLTTTNWTDVLTPPVLNLTNLQNQVIVSPTNGSTFYRLKH